MPSAFPVWTDPDAPLPLSSLILVTFNKVELTLQCLERIYALTDAPFEVILVDNASSDGTAERVRALDYPHLTVLAQHDNLGFGAGCNVGAQAANGEVLVFLNNDILVTRGWLTRMVRAFSAHPQLGVVGPMTNVASNAQLLPPGYPREAEHADAVGARLAREQAHRIALARRVIGFCMALPRSVWEAIGAFDEGFGVGHYEDDDLCLRAERAGYFGAAVCDAYVHHLAGQSFDAAGVHRLSNARKKAFQFYKKWQNAHLDWPDLRLNLTEALHVVGRWRGTDGAMPEWRSGEEPHLFTAVAASGSADTGAELARQYRESHIFCFRSSHAPRPLGEALAAGIACHDAREHLLLPSLPPARPMAELLAAASLARAREADALLLRAAEPELYEGYYVTRAALGRVGVLEPGEREFSALVHEHAERVRGAGMHLVEAHWEGGRWIEVPLDPSHRPRPLPSPWRARKLAAHTRMLLTRRDGGWTAPPPPRRRYPDKTVNITMLSFNRLEFTRQAVEAVRAMTQHPHRLVVVDNGSEPDAVAWLQDAKRHGLIDVLVLNEENLGVARAANQGWLACETDYYVKLDNDIVIEKRGWLAALVEAAERLPDAGMVGYNFEPRSYPVTDVAGLRVRPKATHLGGACVLISPEAHRAAGYWCEDYFPYSEEDFDMGFRLRLAGFRHYYLEEEHIGAHLPRGRATELEDWRSQDDEDDARYRGFKDEARRNHIGTFSTLWANQRLYRRGEKSLYCTPGRTDESRRAALVKRCYRVLHRFAR